MGRNRNRANYFHHLWKCNHCRFLQISKQNHWSYNGSKITQMVIFMRKVTVSNLLNMTLLPSDSSVYCGRRPWQARGEHRSRRCSSETCNLVQDTRTHAMRSTKAAATLIGQQQRNVTAVGTSQSDWLSNGDWPN